MKKIILSISVLLFCVCARSEIKISQLPLISGSSVGSTDSVPLVYVSGSETARVYLSQLFSIPTLASQLVLLAPKDSPSFTTLLGLSYATASTVPYLDASKHLVSSAVTPTQLGYVDFTSSGQTQINTKAPTDSPSFTTLAGFSYATATTVPYLDASKHLVSSAVTPTQLGYLDATSSIQTQINTKAPSASPTFSGTIGTPLTHSTAVQTDSSGNLTASTLGIAAGGTGQTTAANAINALLPSQTGNSGKILGTNGSVASWVGNSLGSQGLKTVFVSSGTFTTPSSSNTSTIYKYEMFGGGAGGGAGNGSNASAGGGGAGAYASDTFTGVAASTGITITINSGGTGGAGGGNNNGAAGGSVVIGAPISITAGGGSGGVSNNFTGAGAAQGGQGGAGGTVTGSPTIVVTGQAGGAGYCMATGGSNGSITGVGASTALGFGGQTSDSANNNGKNATGYGGGGSGGQSTNGSGGNGTTGIVIFTQLTP